MSWACLGHDMIWSDWTGRGGQIAAILMVMDVFWLMIKNSIKLQIMFKIFSTNYSCYAFFSAVVWSWWGNQPLEVRAHDERPHSIPNDLYADVHYAANRLLVDK